MNRFLLVGRGCTTPRPKNDQGGDFDHLRRENFARDDDERRRWRFRGEGSGGASAAERARALYIDPGE